MSDTIPPPSLFHHQAEHYASARPGYPDALFDWLVEQVIAGGLRPRTVWDCATGSGQAVPGLAARFEQVFATDISANQLAHAPHHERVSYHVAGAEASGLEARSVDAVTVATALHWFDLPAFFAEVRRVLRPGGVLLAWSYGSAEVTPEVDALVHTLASETLAPFWAKNIDLVRARYTTIEHPLTPLTLPVQHMDIMIHASTYLRYLRSWSATQRYIETHDADPVAAIEEAMHAAWGDSPRQVRWSLFSIAGRA